MKRKIFGYVSVFVLFQSSLASPFLTVLAEEENYLPQSDSAQESSADSVAKDTESSTTVSSSEETTSESESATETTGTTGTTLPATSSTEKEDETSESTDSNPQVHPRTFADANDANADDLSSWLPDPTLQSIVANALGIEVSEITKEKISKMKTIYIYSTDAALADLTGLEYATSLSSFYMNGTNQISDFSVLTKINSLVYAYLMGANVTDDNVPDFGDNLTRLNLSSANVTNAVYPKILKMNNLESLTFESNMNITTIAPLASLPNLNELRIQFCGVSDFTVINNFPVLENLAAHGQNTGRLDEVTNLSAKVLNYDSTTESFFVPFSIMPNRLTNFDGYVPPFTTSNSQSQTYFDLNGVQLPSSQLTITDQGITVSGITPEAFEDIQTMEYNCFVNNPAGTYAQPDGYSFYSISSGTYLHQFALKHHETAADFTVEYVDTDGNEIHASQAISGNVGDTYDATTDTYKLSITGYTLDATQLPTNGTGTLSDQAQTVTYVYTKDPVPAVDVTVEYVDIDGNEIHAPQAISGNIGDTYDATTDAYKLSITGYTIDDTQLPTNGTGTLSDQAQTVTYVYTKHPVPAVDVTV
ncbi:MucBP domain-containing protein, partial [Enterococcus sp.]|uniref:MucBP domain-containing protein n=1 Tax=Enterococcus sp. TaxID=35783 RepID=UPI0025C15437